MTKQTFADKMKQAEADRKRSIKLSINSTHASKIHTRCQSSEYGLSHIPTRAEYELAQLESEGITLLTVEEAEKWTAQKQQLQAIQIAQDPTIRGFYDGCLSCNCDESQGAMFTTLKGGFICDDCV